jgi:hypothetical protein
MNTFLSNLTALALFIHTLFGCCWHHAHAAGAACDATATKIHSADCCCHQAQGQGANSPGTDTSQSEPCKCRPQCRGACSWLPVKKVAFDAPAALAFHDPGTAPTPLLDHPPGDVLTWLRPELVPAGLPLRLHLLHQVLLI